MFCTKCGNDCTPTQKFCNNCGAPLAPEAQPTSPVIEPAVEPVAAPIVEPVAAPIVEPVAEPVVEPVAEPVAEPVVEPVVEPVAAPIIEPVAPIITPVTLHPEKKLGLGGWIFRTLITLLPLLVTYLLILLDSTGMFASIVKTNSGVKVLATIFLVIIGISIIVQTASLIYWACSKKYGSVARDWALGFIIAAVAITVIAVLASLGMHLFHDAYTKPFAFLANTFTPFGFVYTLFLFV